MWLPLILKELTKKRFRTGLSLNYCLTNNDLNKCMYKKYPFTSLICLIAFGVGNVTWFLLTLIDTIGQTIWNTLFESEMCILGCIENIAVNSLMRTVLVHRLFTGGDVAELRILEFTYEHKFCYHKLFTHYQYYTVLSLAHIYFIIFLLWAYIVYVKCT
jgi:hypothetical protein